MDHAKISLRFYHGYGWVMLGWPFWSFFSSLLVELLVQGVLSDKFFLHLGGTAGFLMWFVHFHLVLRKVLIFRQPVFFLGVLKMPLQGAFWTLTKTRWLSLGKVGSSKTRCPTPTSRQPRRGSSHAAHWTERSLRRLTGGLGRAPWRTAHVALRGVVGGGPQFV